MRRRTLGQTGLLVGELALGSFGLSGDGYGPVEGEVADRTIGRARELGINLFETADSYGASREESFESRLGRVLGPNEPVVFVTKGGNDLAASPPRKRFDRAFLHRSAARSAERLKRAPDVYLLHHPLLSTITKGEAGAALAELVAEGVIKHWGVCCSDGVVASAAIEAGASVIEIAYNMLHLTDFRDIASQVREKNVGLLIRSPLAYGLLCGTWSSDKTFIEGDHRKQRWTEFELQERLRHVAALRPMVHDRVNTLREAALRFVLMPEVVGSVVVGVRNAAQLEANVRAIGEPPYLPEEDVARVSELLASVGCFV